MAFASLTRRFRRTEGFGTLRGGPLRAALRALLADDYEGAEAALTGLVREDSRDVDAYLGLATLYRRRGEVGRAIQVHQNLLLRADLDKHARLASSLASEVGQVLVGQEEMVSGLLTGLLTGGHILLEGLPGLAKTLTVRCRQRLGCWPSVPIS